MCIIEYVGYSCGHSSVPVLRLCPMTTHAPSNPVCKDPSHRPTMVADMCPACSRVMHSRWVDIVMFEHQWMHERGTCGCPTKFPSLLHPRTIGADPGEEAARYAGQTTLRGISGQIGEAISSKFGYSDGGTSATSHDDNVASASANTTPTKSSSLTANQSTYHGTDSAARRYSTNSTTTTTTAIVGQPPVRDSSQHGRDRGQGKKKAHKSIKQKQKQRQRQNQKGKGKGKGKVWNGKQQNPHKNNSEFGRHAMMATHHDTTTSSLLPPLSTLTSEDEIVETFHLPSLEAEAEPATTKEEFSFGSLGSSQKQGRGQQVNVRLASQFAAEWIPDHAERHRTGACSCHVRFERYQPYDVTEAEYYFGRSDSQESSISYLDQMASGVEALGFDEQRGRGNSSYSGGSFTAISPSIAAVPEVQAKEGVFFPFASPSPEMTMSGGGDTGYGTMAFNSPELATLNAAAPAVYDDTAGFATAHQLGPDPSDHGDMHLGDASYTAAQDDYNSPYADNYPFTPAQSQPPARIAHLNPNPALRPPSYPPEQTLRPMDIVHWRVIEASPDPSRAWAAARNRPEDFGFRSVDEAARVLAQTPQHVPIRSRPAAPVAAAEHLPNTLYYQHFDADDPSTYPIVAFPLGAGPEGGPEYCHSPRWDSCDLARPRLRRSRSVDGRS
ncbi:uncharacterized protein PG986_007063 [Apiospora aurea]|uniref:Uncharacterized protein n=1 Tax=Apiospora aurea TaxID=335848 RepID=A0ABR1QBJ2_9PEZI